jgi:8-oxo-dGTP diphosphatase
VRIRPAGRLLLLEPRGRLLLARAVLDRHEFWFTPGGGCQEGETPADAARREVHEETSLQVGDLGPPVLHRRARLRFLGEAIEARETFWLVRLARRPAITPSNLAAYEAEAIMEWHWWTSRELRATADTFYPACLPDLLDALDGTPAAPWLEVDLDGSPVVTRGVAPADLPDWVPVR